jgi:OOP family OmpA-OmpF porin
MFTFGGTSMHKRLLVGVTALFVVSCLSAFADDVNGMIKTRTGETLVVKTDSGDVTVVLTGDTRTVDRKGLFGLSKDEMGNTVLIPGLKVSVDGTRDENGRVVAKEIITDGDDLETSEMIQAGLHPTAQQVAKNVETLESHESRLDAHQKAMEANNINVSNYQQQTNAQIAENIRDIDAATQRFNALSDFDVKGQATVKFAVGSSKIPDADQEQLKQIAQTATGLTGYIVEVTGFADSTGGAEMNTKLSESRAKAVVHYLMQQGNVPVRHIIAPGAMGEYGAAATNETKAGRAENRRVEVKILVNKGITGS